MSRTLTLLLLAMTTALAACGDGESDGERSAAAAVTGAVPVTPPGDPVIEALELSDWYRAILVDRAAVTDPDELEGIARPYCEGLTVCRAAIWFNRAMLPRAMPVAADALEQQAFALGRTANGAENILWNCNFYPQYEARHACLPRVFR